MYQQEIDAFNQRRAEAARIAEQQRQSAQAATIAAQVAEFRQTLTAIETPADEVERRVAQLEQQIAAHVAEVDRPRLEAQRRAIAARFGVGVK